jgi:hypothetical protein
LEPGNVDEVAAGVHLPHRPVVVVLFLLWLLVLIVGGGAPAVVGDVPRLPGHRLRLLHDPHDLLHALQRREDIGIAGAGCAAGDLPAAADVVGGLCLLLELPRQVLEEPRVALDLAHGDALHCYCISFFKKKIEESVLPLR